MKNIGNLFVRLFVISLLTFRYFSVIVSLFGAGAAPFFPAPFFPAPAPSKAFRRLRLQLRLRTKCVGSGGSGSASLLCTLLSQMGPSLFEVRSSGGDTTYLVDPSLGACSCPRNRSVDSCKHLSALHTMHPDAGLGRKTQGGAITEEQRRQMFFIATGTIVNHFSLS